MADKEIRELDAQTAGDRAWLLVIQDDQSPYASEKITLTELFATQIALRTYPVSLLDLHRHDNPTAVLPASASGDDLGMTDGTFGTDAVVVQSSDAKATSATQYARFQFVVPAAYDDGETITFRVNAGMKTTVSDTTATLDVECYRNAAPSVDICATAATSINNITAADKDFTITATNVVAGDILDVRLKIVIVDGATGTAVIGEIKTIDFLMDSTN